MTGPHRHDRPFAASRICRREPPAWSSRLYLRIAPAHMALVRFLLEGVDHLGYLSVLDRTTGLMVFIHSPDQAQEARDFIEAARNTAPIEIVATPGDSST